MSVFFERDADAAEEAAHHRGVGSDPTLLQQPVATITVSARTQAGAITTKASDATPVISDRAKIERSIVLAMASSPSFCETRKAKTWSAYSVRSDDLHLGHAAPDLTAVASLIEPTTADRMASGLHRRQTRPAAWVESERPNP
jgi:hypothetical protein